MKKLGNGHTVYETGDVAAPETIKNTYGDVVLDLCVFCGAVDMELVNPCSVGSMQVNAMEPTVIEQIKDGLTSGSVEFQGFNQDVVGQTQDEGQNFDSSYADDVDAGAPRVRLKWYTPQGDKLLAHMARVSNSKATPDDPADRLIKYLLRNHHWSPFEMVNMCVEVHTERDISAQILRHWTLKFQEFSTRYAEVEELRHYSELRFQHPTNRQSSYTLAELVTEENNPEMGPVLINGHEISDTQHWWTGTVSDTRTRALRQYREALERGVAKEVARRILPIGLMPTVMYINGNLRTWITYFMERSKPGVQAEHREIALAIEPVFRACFPAVWAAVESYLEEQAADVRSVDQMKKITAILSAYLEANGGSGDVVDAVEMVRELCGG